MMASPSMDWPDLEYWRVIGQVRLNDRVAWVWPPGSGGWVLASFSIVWLWVLTVNDIRLVLWMWGVFGWVPSRVGCLTNSRGKPLLFLGVVVLGLILDCFGWVGGNFDSVVVRFNSLSLFLPSGRRYLICCSAVKIGSSGSSSLIG